MLISFSHIILNIFGKFWGLSCEKGGKLYGTKDGHFFRNCEEMFEILKQRKKILRKSEKFLKTLKKIGGKIFVLL